MAIWLSLRSRSDCGWFSWMNRARRQREAVEARLFSKPVEFDGFGIGVFEKVPWNAAFDLIAGAAMFPAVGKARGQARGPAPTNGERDSHMGDACVAPTKTRLDAGLFVASTRPRFCASTGQASGRRRTTSHESPVAGGESGTNASKNAEKA
jgi:hypothetical protein